MGGVVHAHMIPSIEILTQGKTKAHVQLELDSYFDELMCIATYPNLVISTNTMQKYVASLDALKTMTCMLLDVLDRGNRVVHLDAMEVIFFSRKMSP